MNLLGYLPYDQELSDITGFQIHGRQIAVVGLINGTSFVDISDPQNPIELNRIPGDPSTWRDMKFWNNHVYIGTEADMGLQVVDVSNLNNIRLVNTILDFDNSHNIHIWEGYLFIIGADMHDIWIYDLSIPSSPTLVGTWNEDYLHDIDVHNNKIYGMGINSSIVYIIDITDISNPTTLISWFYPGMAHDAAVFPNEQFLVTADEMEGGHLKIWDISDYDNISEISSFQINSSHSIHNIYFKNDLIIGSWYADGTRILDVSDPYNPLEIGFYDTTEIEGLYVGNWGTYVYFENGLIISSDIESGLYIFEMGISINHEQPVEVNIDEPIILQIDISTLASEFSQVSVYHKEYFGDWLSGSMSSCPNNESYHCITISEYSYETIIEYYFHVVNSIGQSAIYPMGGDENPFILEVGELPLIEHDFIEADTGWTVGQSDDDASSGIWEFGIPNEVYVQSGNLLQPGYDSSLEGINCFITGNSIDENGGADDVDGGKTSLLSPFFNIQNTDEIWFSFAYWYSNNLGDNPGNDIFEVDYRNNINSNWTSLYSTNLSTNSWETVSFFLSEYIDEFNQIQLRFVVSDIYHDGDNGSGGSLIEAGIDDLMFKAIYENILFGDANFDGNIDVTDIITMVNIVLGNIVPEFNYYINCDINNDSLINITDIISIINMILE